MANEIQKHLIIVPSAQTTTFITNHVDKTSSDSYYDKVCFLEGTGEIVTKSKKYAINANNINSVLTTLLGLDVDNTDPQNPVTLTTIKNPGKSLVQMFTDAIDALDKSQTIIKDNNETTNAAITIQYSETNGIITIDSLSVQYATFTRTASTLTEGTYSKPNFVMTTGDDEKIVKGKSLDALKNYTDDAIAYLKAEILTGNAGGSITEAYDTLREVATWIANNDEATDASGIVHDINLLQVQQTSATYVSGVIPNLTYTGYNNGDSYYLLKASSIDAIKDYVDAKVTIAQNNANAGIDALDVTQKIVTGTNISFTYTETDGIVTIDNLQEKYASVSKSGNTGEYPTLTVSDADKTKLITANDLLTLGGYTDAAIQSLDATITSPNGTFTNITVTETDGKITAVSVTTSYADVVYTAKNGDTPANLAPTTATGVMIGSDITAIKQYIDSKTDDLNTLLDGMDHTEGANATVNSVNYSYVSVTQTNGAITNMTLSHTIGAVNGETATVTTNGLIDAAALAATLSAIDIWDVYEGES